MKKRLKSIAIPTLVVLFVSSFPVLFLYFQNADEVNFSEVAPALLVFIAVGVVLLIISSIVARSSYKGAIIAAVFAIILFNFALIESVLKYVHPGLKYWHTLTIFIVLGLHLAGFILCLMSEDLVKVVVNVLVIVFAVLIAINIVTNIPGIIGHINAKRQLLKTKKYVEIQTVEADIEKPNIYFIIFDEYSNFSQMHDFYGYDNKPLSDFLEKNSFAVSYTSHNESIISSTIQTNWINLDYLVDNNTPESEKEALRKQGRLFSLMREKGYNVQIFETGDFYGGTLPISESNNTAAMTSGGETISEIIAKNTIIYPFLVTDKIEFLNGIHELTNYMSSPEALPKGGTFTLLYINFPHAPFLVDENGAAISALNSTNWKDNQYYLGQFKYATKLMIQVVDNIIGNDPQSIVLLQSDHGARAADDRSQFMEKFPLEVMNNPLNAVYYMGKRGMDIEGLSSVNTLRAVLNELWDMDYKMLEIPEDTYRYK